MPRSWHGDFCSSRVAFLVAALIACGGSGPAFSQSRSLAVPVEGEPFAATLTRIDADWNLALETDNGPRRLSAAELVRWGAVPELDHAPWIVLADGGALSAEVLSIDGERLLANSLLFGEVSFPIAHLRGVVFHPPAERLERDRLFDRVVGAEGSRDRLLLENGDVVEGLLSGEARRPVQGPPPTRDRPRLETLRMQVKDGVAEVPVERVVALMLNPALVEPPAPGAGRAWIGFENDGLLLVERVESQAGVTTLTLSGGARLTTDNEGFRDSVHLVQPLGNGVAYLSDQTPVGYRHLPYLTLAWDYGEDRNVLGGRLRSNGQTYLKGLGMHSTSRLAYRLEERHKRFKAELALDESAGREGSVIYRVYTADASGQWKPAYESQVVRGGDPPIPITVPVEGARGVALIVEHADRGDVLDHANWLDARLE